MKKTLLFAIDTNSEETIVSESEKGSNQIKFLERIHRNTNPILFNAVIALTSITNSNEIDIPIFKAMDKVCQMIYNKHIEIK
jgi:hypothetical protein